jgi:hypothetical protein
VAKWGARDVGAVEAPREIIWDAQQISETMKAYEARAGREMGDICRILCVMHKEYADFSRETRFRSSQPPLLS